MFGRRLAVLCALVACSIVIGLDSDFAWAQVPIENRESSDQTIRNRSQPGGTQFKFRPPPRPSLWKTLFGNMHGSYSVSLMGPRAAGAGNSTFNIFIPDIAPIQLYHSASVYFQVTPDFNFGFGMDAIQNISDGVAGQSGFVRNRSFVLFDPYVTFSFPNLVQVPGWSVFTSANFSLAVTQASIDIGRITSINLNQNWRVLTFPSDWTYGFDINLNPQFYTQPFPTGFQFRQTFYASIGHYLGYRISPQVQLANTTTFDINHREPLESGAFQFSPALFDRMRFALTVNPSIAPLNMSIGTYFQFLIWNPAFDTSIFGLDFSIGF